MLREESPEPFLEAGGCGVGVNADGPEPGLLRDRLPELLGYPEDLVLREGPASESVGQYVQALCGKGTEGVAIESVTGSDKQAGPEPLSTQNRESGSNPLPLYGWIDAREFSLLMQTENGRAATRARVTVSVHGDRGARSLQ